MPRLKNENLVGAFRFSDSQMNDYKLGMWVADRAKETVKIIENSKVNKIDLDGNIIINDSAYKFDRIVNTCGPSDWELIEKSNIEGQFKLDLVEEVILINAEPDHIFS